MQTIVVHVPYIFVRISCMQPTFLEGLNVTIEI